MKILIVTYSVDGGAGKALFRIAGHLRAFGHDARMLVARKTDSAEFVATTDCPAVLGTINRHLARAAILLATGSRASDRSLGYFSGGLATAINASDADVVMLGWIGEESLSIAEVARIRKPLLWRFSDMWPLTGTEHYAEAGKFFRYTRAGAEEIASARDLDAWVFRRKCKLWQMAPTAICPSKWMADCIAASAIACHWPVRVIPTPVDTDIFKPENRQHARQLLGLPPDRRLLIFSALHADSDARKGWDLLTGALQLLDPAAHGCIVVGRNPASPPLECPLPIFDIGLVHDERRLASLHAAADVAVLPSRLDNLPQSGLEAQACGCPVVAFDAGGMRDLVENGASGLLARPFEVEDLAAAIRAIIDHPHRQATFSRAARQRALALWSPTATIPSFVEVFGDAVKDYGRINQGAGHG